MMITLILVCEVMFWVLVAGGLGARYLLRRRLLSTVLLLSVPVLDVILITAVAIHLGSGGTAEPGHALGVLYFGFTVAYGHSMIHWADGKFAHRFAGAPKPPPAPKYGAARRRREVVGWAQGLAACALSGAALGVLILWVGDAGRTEMLGGSFTPLAIFMFWNTVLTVWGLVESFQGADADTGAAAGDDRAAAGADR
ncbi:hypothetical protein CLV63_102256 [Murinocardiopsis flavida]|uniref:Uncharacterized protein n=1 Tax=Murinocardiopsis flavida TaxID=645275 RepID=A0A2P8DSE2_9ACTN|nr:hypothetical protein [Murinocardiopsis flavida]PSL00130.1 hypothetical protein CLV63_102256 [Murinocardiopsis flavida]